MEGAYKEFIIDDDFTYDFDVSLLYHKRLSK